MKKKLLLTGMAGYCEGETFSVPEGGSAVVGRSRSCDFSLRKLRSWLEADEEERESAEEFKTVSRRHMKLEVIREGDDVKVRITDLSRNGTFVDEERISSVVEITDWSEVHYCRLGELEQFKMELVDAGEEEAVEESRAEAEEEEGAEAETDSHEKEEGGEAAPGEEEKEEKTGEEGDAGEEEESGEAEAPREEREEEKDEEGEE